MEKESRVVAWKILFKRFNTTTGEEEEAKDSFGPVS